MPRKKVSESSEKVSPVSQALSVQEPAPITKVQPFSTVAIQEAVGRLENVRRFITKALNQGYQRELKKLKGRKPNKNEEKALKALEIDYGSIPGVNKKFLLQPGAEKICLWLRVRPKYETVVAPVPDNPGHVEVESRVVLFAVGTGEEIFSGPLTSCSSMESNFRYRWVKIDAKVCTTEWRSKVGFPGKQLGTHKCYPVYKDNVKTGDWEWSERHENPNIWDERNKVRQMGEKRALVKAVRNFGALSEIFTEDPSEWKLDDESNVPASEEPQDVQMGRVVRATPTDVVAVTGKAETVPVGPENGVVSGVESIVELHFPSDNADVALIVRAPQAFLDTIRDIGFFNDIRKCYQLAASDAAEVQARAEAAGLKYVEIAEKAKPKPPEPAKPANAKMPPKGMVTNVRMSGENTKPPNGAISVLYAGTWCYCYVKPLFEHLSKAVGKECEFVFADSPMPKIEAIKRIGTMEWDPESGLPVIQQKDR